MAEKRKGRKYARRDFLKEVAAGGALASTLGAPSFAGQSNKTGREAQARRRGEIILPCRSLPLTFPAPLRGGT